MGQLATQYAKAIGYKVIGVDISDEVLAVCKKQGADYAFNSRTNKTYVEEVRKLTTNGLGAATVAVFSAAGAAYKSAPPLLKLGGVLMCVGLPADGVIFDALDIARGTFKVRGDFTGIPQRMPEAIDFIVKHPEVETFSSLDCVPQMIETMKAGKSTKKMVVTFM